MRADELPLNDHLAICHSTNLAMVKIEDMENYEAIDTLVGNAEDILQRAKDRRSEVRDSLLEEQAELLTIGDTE